jgi:signal transduction histidine kinase/streptogramin lyase
MEIGTSSSNRLTLSGQPITPGLEVPWGSEHSFLSLMGAASFVVCIVLLCSSPMQAQRWHAAATTQLSPQSAPPLADMAHMSWVRRDGAPSDITALAQTKDGYLWIGSGLGLYRFDGLQFSAYPFTSADPQLPSSNISALAASPDGGLWIGYRMGGMTYLHNGKKSDYNKHDGLVSESTEQLLCRDDGSVWATADGRVMRFTGSGWENFSAKHGLASDGLYTSFFDRDGNLWTAYSEHVFELKKGSNQFEQIPAPNHTVNQFAQTSDGTIWISDAWKSVRPLMDEKSKQAVRIPGVPLLLVDDDNGLWVAHDTGGLTRIKLSAATNPKVENYSIADGLTDGQTRAVLKDNQGTIWIGTARGLDRFQSSPLEQFHGVRLDYYPALVADKKSGIWIDDMDKPLMRWQGGKLSFFGKAHGSSSLFQDTDGAVWLHDPITHNFFRFTEDGDPPTAIPVPEIAKEVENWCFGQDTKGAMLACFEGHGLWRYSGSWEQLKGVGLPVESPLSLVKGEGGRVWLGYPHNQIALDIGNSFRIYGANDGLELNAVLTFLDSDGMVLAGGSDGLAYFDGQRFHSLHLRSPELMRNISGIVEDRAGDLWLNGGSGVIHLPLDQWKTALQDPQYAMDFQFLSDRDGLVGSPAQSKPTPSAVVDHDGKLWFATSGHLFSIDPKTVKKEQTTPNVLLQSVLVNGSVLNYVAGNSIAVDSRRLRNLEFDYIAVDLKSPNRVVYQYMLEGQDRQWQDVGGRRQAYYTNLAPGAYRFRVRAASSSGKWSELQSSQPFTVTPAFYQTKWFFLVCVAVLAGCIWMAYQWRVHQVAMRLDSQFEARLSERTRIAQELHDTLLQGVLSASMQLNVADDQLAADSPAKALVQRVLQLMGGVIEEGRNAVQGLRVSKEGTKDLEQAFSRIPQELAIRDAADFRLVVEGTPRVLHPIIRDEIYRIGREAVTNAFRHAVAKTIDLSMEYGADELRVAVRDDGCGIDSKVLQSGRDGHWGLAGMRERAERIGGTVKLWSSAGNGTEVELRVPGRIAFESSALNGRSKWLPKSRARKEPESPREERAV